MRQEIFILALQFGDDDAYAEFMMFLASDSAEPEKAVEYLKEQRHTN